MEVFFDAEMERIEALPRRPHDWSQEDLDRAVRLLTGYLKKPQGKYTLRPIQARALVEAGDHKRLLAEVGAGQGKFLLSALLPVILEAKRTLLLVPAKLRQQTEDEWLRLSDHFRFFPLFGVQPVGIMDPQVRVLSYESLSHIRYATYIDEYAPDLIVADEAHFLARLKAGRSKRIFRYIKQTRKAGNKVTFIPMSGTMRRKSIRECAHLYEAALEKDSPLPTHWPTLEQWCAALDEGVTEDARLSPGALLRLCSQSEKAEGIDGVRRALRRRLVETPGVVATTESNVGVPLVMQVRNLSVPTVVRGALERLRTMYELPDGDTCDSGITAWNHAREMACGFSYKWEPAAPKDWLDARRAWNAFVRNAIEKPPKGIRLDTPLMVWQAVEHGHFGHVPEFHAWKAIRESFEPNPVPLWMDDFLVKDAEDWALATGGIVWVGHTSAYTKQAAANERDDADLGVTFTRIPYFGAGDNRILTYKGPCAASIRSHGTGKNLQQWSRALITSLPSSGASLEQLLARHHRPGQEADEVLVEWYCHTREQYEAFCTARRDAAFMEATSGNIQRVTSCVHLAADGHAFRDEPYEKLIAEGDVVWRKNGQ